MLVSLVSPVYNEESIIDEFVERASNCLHKISGEYEIILVNDCSKDGTLRRLDLLAPKFPALKVINLTRRSGQHIATAVGLNKSRGDLVFIMDSDLQIAPEDMMKLFEFGKQNSGWDIISGQRTTRSESIIRRISSKIISALLKKIGNTNIEDPGSTFKLLKRSVVEQLREYDILTQNLPILMMYLDFRIIELPVEYNIKKGGKSHYKFKDLFATIFLALLNFTSGLNTLIFLLGVGFLLAISGILGTSFLILQGIIERVPLRTNLLIFFSFLLLVGIQFIFLGILAFKLERINRNLDFRKTFSREMKKSSREDICK